MSSCPNCGVFLGPTHSPNVPCPACHRSIVESLDLRPWGQATGQQPQPAHGSQPPPAEDPYQVPVHPGWKIVRVGAMLLFISVLVHLFTGALGTIAAADVLKKPTQSTTYGRNTINYNPRASQRRKTPSTLTLLLNLVMNCLGLIGGLLGFVGLCLFCAMPSECRAKGWAFVSLVSVLVNALCLAVLVWLVMEEVTLGQSSPTRGSSIFTRPVFLPLLVGIVVSSFIASLSLFLFLKGVADFWQERRLGNQFLICFVFSWVVPLVLGAGIGLFLFSIPPTTLLQGIWWSMVCWGVVFLVLAFWFLSLLSQLIQLPGRKLA